MTRFGVALGAQRNLCWPCWYGRFDCHMYESPWSQTAAGQQLADGKTMDYIINHTNMVVEGFFATDIIYKMACEHHIEMPITKALYGSFI